MSERWLSSWTSTYGMHKINCLRIKKKTVKLRNFMLCLRRILKQFWGLNQKNTNYLQFLLPSSLPSHLGRRQRVLRTPPEDAIPSPAPCSCSCLHPPSGGPAALTQHTSFPGNLQTASFLTFSPFPQLLPDFVFPKCKSNPLNFLLKILSTYHCSF